MAASTGGAAAHTTYTLQRQVRGFGQVTVVGGPCVVAAACLVVAVIACFVVVVAAVRVAVVVSGGP